MKKILNIILVGTLLMFTASDLFSSGSQSSSSGEFIKVGATGCQFLKIGPGARANGMGGAYTAIADDLSSVFWNPAGIADVRSLAAQFAYTQWFADFNHNFAAVSAPISDNFVVGVHLVSFGCNRIEITTMSRPEGTNNFYSVNDLALGATFGGYLTDQFSFGVSARYISTGFADLSAGGFSFYIGTKYKTGLLGTTVGFAIQNFGTEMEYSGTDLNTKQKIVDELNSTYVETSFLTSSFAIPLTFRAGISSELYNDEGEHKIIGALDFITLADSPELFILGAEYTFKDLLSIRAGYCAGQDQFGLSGGIGIKYNTGTFIGDFDYSISPTKDLGLVNRFTLGIRL